MNVLCTICARGGSKGVPHKNIRQLQGKPLIVHTIQQALNSDIITRTMVSTDSEEIAAIAKESGAEVPFLRPKHLATDRAPKLPVLQHAVKYYIRHFEFTPDYVIDLQPTSPLRTIEDIKKCFDIIHFDSSCDLVITGYKSNKNPYFDMVEIDQDGYVYLCKKTEKVIARRQDAKIVYAMNGSIYVWRTHILLNQTEIISGKVKIYEMPEE